MEATRNRNLKWTVFQTQIKLADGGVTSIQSDDENALKIRFGPDSCAQVYSLCVCKKVHICIEGNSSRAPSINEFNSLGGGTQSKFYRYQCALWENFLRSVCVRNHKIKLKRELDGRGRLEECWCHRVWPSRSSYVPDVKLRNIFLAVFQRGELWVGRCEVWPCHRVWRTRSLYVPGPGG